MKRIYATPPDDSSGWCDLRFVDRPSGRGHVGGVFGASAPENEENARRLAACWNACMAISTETLERIATRNDPDGELERATADAADPVPF